MVKTAQSKCKMYFAVMDMHLK